MATIHVNPGGPKTTVTVTSEDMQTAAAYIESECPAVKGIELELQDSGDSKVYGASVRI